MERELPSFAGAGYILFSLLMIFVGLGGGFQLTLVPGMPPYQSPISLPIWMYVPYDVVAVALVWARARHWVYGLLTISAGMVGLLVYHEYYLSTITIIIGAFMLYDAYRESRE